MDARIAKRNQEVKKLLTNLPSGRPKSGRTWKTKRISSHTDLRLGKNLRTSYEEKMKQKAEMKSVKEFENRLKSERHQRLEEKRQKSKEKKLKKLENEKKNEIVTPIRNPAKIKKTKKKFLRVVKS